jgi:predicted regulator of Ras-like GTPase activity (Roadblock/LC7/MglB family)
VPNAEGTDDSRRRQALALREVLVDIAEIEGVQGAFLAASDGLVIAANGDRQDAADLRAALIAAAFATIDRAISLLDVGGALLTSIETTTHILHAARLGELLLVVIANRQASSGLIKWEMRRAARRLAHVST